jgi:glyoxylase I family protein
MLFRRRQLLQILPFAFGSSFVLSRDLLGEEVETTERPVASPSASGSMVRGGVAQKPEREKVTGIGGFFFRARDPKAMGRWYQGHLGVSLAPSSYEDSVWQQEAGPTVFEAQSETSDLFGDAHKNWIVNFRVRDLDKMATQLRAAGIKVDVDPKTYPNGRFASLHDPEGNPIQLWQPKSPGASQ